MEGLESCTSKCRAHHHMHHPVHCTFSALWVMMKAIATGNNQQHPNRMQELELLAFDDLSARLKVNHMHKLLYY